jgi:hypothetical protein
MRSRIGVKCALSAVLTLALSSCGGSRGVTPEINQRAALNGRLPWNPLQWNVITTFADRRTATMSVLYGNDAAVRYARANSQQAYPAGSVLALVTWTQQDDAHWFGAKIPGPVKSVEFVSVTGEADNKAVYSYENYEGSPLRQTSVWNGNSPDARAGYLLSLRAAVLP